MGLDSIHLVMEIEKTFSIKIPDEAAERMATVGEVFDYILAKRPASTSPKCLSSIVFFRLRRASRELGIRHRFGPSDATCNLLPPTNRRLFWQQLQSQTSLRLPVLQRPQWLAVLGVLAVIGSAISTGITARIATDSELWGIILAIVVGVVVIYVGEWITQPWAICPGRSWHTLRGLTESVLALNFEKLAAENQGVNAGDIWITLRTLIVEQLGVAPEEVHLSANFINDLGLD